MQKLLSNNKFLFSIWCFVASFGAYFSMYAFRKPFSAALFEGDDSVIVSKAVFILSQVLGYMCSKVIGVKVISELKETKRVVLIIGLIVFAQLTLLLFALVPLSFKFLFLFLNGLPLGMIWGIVFSFLEGRKVTEFIASGLCISAIVSSGFLKSLGRFFIEAYKVSDYWMPALIGGLFIPLFLGFVWMLSQIPPPSQEDKRLKKERVPMNKEGRRAVIYKYGLGMSLLILSYAMLSIFRDFRDNFSVEIWKQMNHNSDLTIYAKTETIIAIMVVLFMGGLSLFRSIKKGIIATYLLMGLGFALIFISTMSFENHILSPFYWMVLSGGGLYLAYVPFQVVIYEKLIAWLDIQGNAGFLMYLSDSTGYLFTVIILIGTKFISWEIDWLNFIIQIAYITGFIGLTKLLFSFFYFLRAGKREIVLQKSEL